MTSLLDEPATTLDDIKTEVPCKKLAELPRNAAEPMLALNTANKNWSRLPEDVCGVVAQFTSRLLYTSDAADELSRVDSGLRRATKPNRAECHITQH